MMKKPEAETNNHVQDDSPNAEKKKIIKAWVTINLWSIKSEKKEEVVEEKEEVVEVVKDEKTLFYESLTSKVLKEEEKDEQKVTKPKIDLKSIKKSESSDDSSEWMKEDEKWDTEEISANTSGVNTKKEDKDLFLNYESDYKKKESKVIDTIHKLKEIADLKKLTKTNKVFVVSIIMATVLGLSFLFYIDPETHSLENYKTSILTLAWKQVTQAELDDHKLSIQNDIDWQLNQNNLWWYDLDFEILINDLWEAVYKFDGIEYTSKDALDVAIKDKLKVLKKEKIKNYLKTKKEPTENQ
jgi:hypothetical protein